MRHKIKKPKYITHCDCDYKIVNDKLYAHFEYDDRTIDVFVCDTKKTLEDWKSFKITETKNFYYIDLCEQSPVEQAKHMFNVIKSFEGEIDFETIEQIIIPAYTEIVNLLETKNRRTELHQKYLDKLYKFWKDVVYLKGFNNSGYHAAKDIVHNPRFKRQANLTAMKFLHDTEKLSSDNKIYIELEQKFWRDILVHILR